VSGGRDPVRWRGQAGFFEIWFAVVMEPSRRRAWWLRHCVLAPGDGAPPRATTWAAAFDGDAPAIVLTAHATVVDVPAAARAAAAGRWRAELAGGGHRVAWDVAVALPATSPSPSRWLEALPAPTRVAHRALGARATGWIDVDGAHHVLADARAVQKHLWGTRRVDELLWLCAPGFDQAPATTLEATAVTVVRGRGPGLVLAHVGGDGARRWTGPLAGLRSRLVAAGPGRLRLAARAATARLDAVASCDPRTLASWDYRDPSGFDVHVAQSDVARCEAVLRTRAHPLAAWGPPRRLTAPQAAVEFHHREPLPGLAYVPWDGTRGGDAR